MVPVALTHHEIESRLANSRAEILALGVRRLALFGSVSRGAAGPDSDVDVLVDFTPEQKTYNHFIALAELLEGVLARSVDLLTFESLTPFLRPQVLAEARDVIRAA